LRNITYSDLASEHIIDAAAYLSDFSEASANRFVEIVTEELSRLRDRLDILRPPVDAEASAFIGVPVHKLQIRAGSSYWHIYYSLTPDEMIVHLVRHGAARPLMQENEDKQD